MRGIRGKKPRVRSKTIFPWWQKWKYELMMEERQPSETVVIHYDEIFKSNWDHSSEICGCSKSRVKMKHFWQNNFWNFCSFILQTRKINRRWTRKIQICCTLFLISPIFLDFLTKMSKSSKEISVCRSSLLVFII